MKEGRPLGLKIAALVVFLECVGLSRCGVYNKLAVQKARCYANCLTMVSNAGAPDVGCHGDNCRQCTKACEMVSKSLDDCKAACANSTWCETSCQYIQTTVNTWSNIYDGDGSPIPKPPIPIATNRTLTSLELAWQPVVVNVSGSVVYLLKKKSEQKNEGSNNDLAMVLTEPKAVLTVQQVCNSVPNSKELQNKLNFYFTVVALTENSTLVKGDTSKAIEMIKPNPVTSINKPSFSYNDPYVRISTSFIPSNSSHVTSLTGYIATWSLVWSVVQCQSPWIHKKSINRDKSNTDIEFNLFNKLYANCKHTIQVFSMMHCVASNPKGLVYTFPGCYNVAGFDPKKCFKFDPPPSSDSSRTVGNLTHSPIQTDADFRFRVNITWLQPTYHYYNTTNYEIRYGNAAKRHPFLKNLWHHEHDIEIYGSILELKNLLPNIEYKYGVKPQIPSVKKIESFGLVKMPELPKDALKVRNVLAQNLGFSESHDFSFNVSWTKPSFSYGNLVGYTIYTTEGNSTTNLTYYVVRGLEHSEPIAVEITPIYSQSWITGTSVRTTVKGNDPNRDYLSVQNLKKIQENEDQTNNWYRFVFSWTPPKFKYKTLGYYQVSYSISGYPYHVVNCKYGQVNKTTCGDSRTKNTTYIIPRVLPSEHIVITVKPIFLNSTYVKGIASTLKIDAPYPRRNLVEVRNLTYVGISKINGTNTMKIAWKPPQFNHSTVSTYIIKSTIAAIEDTKPTVKRTRRAINNQTGTVVRSVTTTSFSSPVIGNGKQMIIEVTPVFVVEIIIGEKSSITISNPAVPVKEAKSLSAFEIAAISLAVFILMLAITVLVFWFIRRQQQIKDGLLVGGKGAVIDQWEVPIDKVFLEDELGEGAFGKVFKAVLLELPEQSSKYSIARNIRKKSLKPLNQDDGFVVAVKMLHDMADNDQRREFLKEIQLMKDVGSHRNIVNMLGCGTLSDPMFLIVEYLPNGDLLHYLRKRRGKVKEYPESDPRGPYHSTYCQTYFNKNNPEAGITLQPSRSDRIYVHSPELAKQQKKDDIQLLSVQESNQETDNNETAINVDASDLYDDDIDDGLTPGDLMAFAWQVSQGMEYLSKHGYVHRDLAARNVLVGNNKEAKIADFGLTRHMYENLYQAKTNRKLPLKWMSVEAIFDQSFTSQSDVWAYGVFLWELVTLGGTPYPSINNRELLKLLKEGYRMEKPETCDTELYDIMYTCWKELPEDRPTFEDIRSKLEEMMTRDNPYFDPSAVDESRDYYNVPSFNSAPDPDDDDDVIGDIIGEGSSTNKNDDEHRNSKTGIDNELITFLTGDTWEMDNDAPSNNNQEIELDQVVFDNEQSDSREQTDKNGRTNVKYASLDFCDLEFQIYRHQNKGFVL